MFPSRSAVERVPTLIRLDDALGRTQACQCDGVHEPANFLLFWI